MALLLLRIISFLKNVTDFSINQVWQLADIRLEKVAEKTFKKECYLPTGKMSRSFILTCLIAPP